MQETRRLSSDVVFVRAPGTALPWWLLRDVYEVDGRPFATGRPASRSSSSGGRPSASSGRGRSPTRAPASISAAASGTSTCRPSCSPSSTLPAAPLLVREEGAATIEGRSFVEIAFRELAAPTVIRGPDVAAGRARRGSSLDPRREGRHGGRTELVLDLAGDGVRTRATLTTEYRPYRALALWVPVEMRDRLQTELVGARGRSGSVEVVEGLAAYSGFRQAGVSTAGGVPTARARTLNGDPSKPKRGPRPSVKPAGAPRSRRPGQRPGRRSERPIARRPAPRPPPRPRAARGTRSTARPAAP